MEDKRFIRIGFFEDFKGEDSVLIDADIHGLLELESMFVGLSNGNSSTNLNELKYLDKDHKLNITLNSGDKNEGLKKIENDFFWNLSSNKWSEFREKTTALYRVSTNGHQYLDSNSIDNLDLQVVLSLNEYGKEFWTKFDSRK